MSRHWRITDEQVQTLIADLYEAPGDQARWQESLQRLCRLFDSHGGVFWLLDQASHSHPLMHAFGLDPAGLAIYQQHYYREDVWVRAGAFLPAGGVTVGEALIPHRQLVRLGFYNDVLASSDVDYMVCARVVKSPRWLGHFSVFRSRTRHDFSAREIQLMKALAPHLQRAVELHLRIRELSERAAVASAALDELAAGIVIVDRQGKPLLVNRSAHEMIRRRDGLELDSRHLYCVLSAESRALGALIAHAAELATASGTSATGAMTVSRTSGVRPYVLWVAPLRGSTLALVGGKGAVIVFVSDPDRRMEIPISLLEPAYGLTPAEARLVAALVSGMTVAQHARAECIACGTARWHLKQAMAKTGTHSSVELVRLILTGPAGSAAGP